MEIVEDDMPPLVCEGLVIPSDMPAISDMPPLEDCGEDNEDEYADMPSLEGYPSRIEELRAIIAACDAKYMACMTAAQIADWTTIRTNASNELSSLVN